MSKKMSPRKAVIEAFMQVCGEQLCDEHGVNKKKMREILARSIHKGSDDPGGWAPTAPVVACNEDFSGDWCYRTQGGMDWIDAGVQIGDIASELCEQVIFAEQINDAVMAFYPG